MSKVSIEDTAISSALAQDVTARKRESSRATAPWVPSRALAEKAHARPAEMSLSEGKFGYVGNWGWSARATAARPNVVASPKGIANLRCRSGQLYRVVQSGHVLQKNRSPC
jgi:hypothetical protein